MTTLSPRFQTLQSQPARNEMVQVYQIEIKFSVFCDVHNMKPQLGQSVNGVIATDSVFLSSM